jgi:hypothetical protein
MAGDSFSEVSRKGWFERIAESIKGVLIGGLLFLVSFVVLFWNEGRAVDTARALDEAQANVVSISDSSVDPGNEGKLVHLTGEATTQEVLTDPEFQVSERAIHLKRGVEIYQWKQTEETKTEKEIGGGEKTIPTYHYNKEWVREPIDSSRFKERAGHTNPPGPKPYKDEDWQAKDVTLGAFQLPSSLVSMIGGPDRILMNETTLSKLSPSLRDQLKAHDGLYYQSNDPAHPDVGDVRIELTVVRPKTVSVMAQQVGSTFEAYHPKSAKHPLELLVLGTKSADEMIAAEKTTNTILTWVLRLVGFVLMALGIYLVLKPLVVLADVLPLLGNLLSMGVGLFACAIALVLSLVTIAVGWLFYRPLLGGALLVGALLVLAGVIYLGSRLRRSPAALDRK